MLGGAHALISLVGKAFVDNRSEHIAEGTVLTEEVSQEEAVEPERVVHFAKEVVPGST